MACLNGVAAIFKLVKTATSILPLFLKILAFESTLIR